MATFTPEEAEFLLSHRIGRIATVGLDGLPHIVPLAYRYNPDLETIDLGGHGEPNRKRYHQNLVRAGAATFLVDDFVAPGRPRAVEIKARAEVLPEGGQAILPDFAPGLVRLWPSHILSWGIHDADPFKRSSRDVS